MKKRTLMTSLVAAAALVAAGVFAAAQAATSTDPVDLPVTAGTQVAGVDTATALRFAREEERMARDLYATLADRYDGALPFAMITRSEQHHFDAVGVLLDRYGVADPAKGAKAGTYADPTLQKLYDQWLKQGQTSLSAAYDVGVALEQRDIADLEDTLATVEETDVRRVLTALLNASQHHLAAFQAAADGRQPTGIDRDRPGSGYGMGHGMTQGAGPGIGQRMGRGAGDCPMLESTSD